MFVISSEVEKSLKISPFRFASVEMTELINFAAKI